MKVESFLPVFPGFYGTIFEANEEPYIEDGKTYEWYYSEYEVRACVGVIEGWLSDFDIKVTYQELISPREYNFTNDSINGVNGKC